MELELREEASALAKMELHQFRQHTDHASAPPFNVSKITHPDAKRAISRMMNCPNEILQMIVQEVVAQDVHNEKERRQLLSGRSRPRITSMTLCRVNKYFQVVAMEEYYNEASAHIIEATDNTHAWLFGNPPSGPYAAKWNHASLFNSRLLPQVHIQRLELDDRTAFAIAHYSTISALVSFPALRTLVLQDRSNSMLNYYPWSLDHPAIVSSTILISNNSSIEDDMFKAIKMLQRFCQKAPQLKSITIERRDWENLAHNWMMACVPLPSGNVHRCVNLLNSTADLDSVMMSVAKTLIKNKHRLPLSDSRIRSIAHKVFSTTT